MSKLPYWRWNATDTAQAIRQGQASAQAVVQSVLDRIADVNPTFNALPDVLAADALAAAQRADEAVQQGKPLGPLHGVPVTIKVNVDTAGRATTDGIVAMKDQIAVQDSPLVKSLREAGAIVVARSNTPAFSLRWFTDNDLHGRTLNPFDASRTPGGSSGGAAAAVATGMGAIGHGNDYGGSIRYPAWACGVVGLRPSHGRVPAFKATSPSRVLTSQLMSVQGPLTRTVADARLALSVMAKGSALDPDWVPASLTFGDSDAPIKVALFKAHPGFDADPGVVAALEQAAAWLREAGYQVDEVAPPEFEAASRLWHQMVFDDMRRGGKAAIESMGDAGVKGALKGYLHGLPESSRDQTLEQHVQRLNIRRAWSVFFADYPVVLMPISWQKQFPIDADCQDPAHMAGLLNAQSPLLATAMLGLPGLSVPTGMHQGLPTGVQLCGASFREDQLLRVGEAIEPRAKFSALDTLYPLA